MFYFFDGLHCSKISQSFSFVSGHCYCYSTPLPISFILSLIFSGLTAVGLHLLAKMTWKSFSLLLRPFNLGLNHRSINSTIIYFTNRTVAIGCFIWIRWRPLWLFINRSVPTYPTNWHFWPCSANSTEMAHADC